jgi:hypothetical protein
MDALTVLDEWETSSFDGGLEEAARLARRGFSGAIRADSDWLFLAEGDPVAVVSDLDGDPTVGDVDALENASGELLEAPHPAVARLAPLLAVGGEVRGEYFSDDTPVGTVQETLEDGGFTGYVELSENVLSGDYYVAVEEGRASYVAFVGSTEQLHTGADAEEKTKNEVGIYSVVAVDLPDVSLPEPPADGGAAGGIARGTGEEPGPDAGTDPAAARDVDDPGSESAAGIESGGRADDATGAHGTGRDTTSHAATSDRSAEAEESRGVGADGEPAADRTVPSLDPERSEPAGDTADTTSAATADGESTDDAPAEPSRKSAPEGATETGRPTGEAAGAGDAASTAAVEELRSEVRQLRSAVDRLEGRVATLEAGGEGAGGGGTSGGTAGPTLTPGEAVSNTTLFVREGTRGGPTLEDARDGHADRDATVANVELERHTRFDESGATVDGESYDAFLSSSQGYAFVKWLTTELLFEIRATDSESGMSGLYEAVPEIDRVFFDETVTFEADDGTVDIEFDVVGRDRNGAPLFVATLEDRRDPTRSDRIERLVTDASDFCAATGSVVAAFAVTASYFEPEAVDVAREATTSSLLRREKHRSYVNLTRTSGFHLCLVEARESAFHLTVPEL